MDQGWYTYDRFTAADGRPAGARSTCAARPSSATTGAARSGCGWPSSTPTRVDRIVLMDTGVFTGRQPMSEAWHRFAAFVERTEELPVGLLVRRGCFTDPGDAVAAAYDAPFPNEASKAGARAFPAILPLRPERPRRGRPARACSTRCARTRARCCCSGAPRTGRCRRAPARRSRPRSAARRPRRIAGRRPLPPGGPGRPDRRDDRRLAGRGPVTATTAGRSRRRGRGPGVGAAPALGGDLLLGRRRRRGRAGLVGRARRAGRRATTLLGVHRAGDRIRATGAEGRRRARSAGRAGAGPRRRSGGSLSASTVAAAICSGVTRGTPRRSGMPERQLGVRRSPGITTVTSTPVPRSSARDGLREPDHAVLGGDVGGEARTRRRGRPARRR